MYSIILNVPETTTVITKQIVKEHASGRRYNVKKVTIPKHIQRIDDRAFEYCRSLEEVIFEQESICTEIGELAFYKCRSLKRINLPNTIVAVDRDAFDDCDSLEEINLPQNLTEIELNVPETTTVITFRIVNEHASVRRRYVKKVTIPKHIQRIDKYAFQDCRSLEEVIFEQESICTEIGRDAFSRCTSLKRINLPNTIVAIDNSAFDDCDSLEEINLPQNLTEISGFAFSSCKSLKQIVLPNSITRIGCHAFAFCKSLVYAYLPTSIQHIDENAFKQCYSLSVIAAPQHTDIDPSAFPSSTIIDKVSKQIGMENNALLRQRFINHPLHQICYDPAITNDSLTKAIKQINDTNDNYKHVDAFDMNALHILSSNPNATDEMVTTLVAACPSLRSMQSVEGLTPVIMYVKNKYGNEAKNFIENKERLALDDSLRHRILREDDTVYMLASDYAMQEELRIEDKNRLRLGDFLRHRILREDDTVYMLASDYAMQEELRKLDEKDEQTGLYHFMQIAMNKSYNLESLYWLFQKRPHLLTNIDQLDLVQKQLGR